MLVTDIPIMKPADYPAGCEDILSALPNEVSARLGSIPGFDSAQFALWDGKRRMHVCFESSRLDRDGLRVALRNLGHDSFADRYK